MKKTLFILSLFSLVAFTSCEKTNDTDELPGMDDMLTDDEGNPLGERLVDSEIIATDDYATYSYLDGDSLLVKATRVLGANSQDVIVTYNENGSVATYSTSFGSLEFTYDTDGKLLSYDNTTFTYTDNTVTVTGDIEAELQLNANGQVTKMTETNGYTEYTYNGTNVVGVDRYDSSDALIESYAVSYDDKKNPFLGQLQSIYLERFLFSFYPSENGFLIGSFSGYDFPFLTNNLTEISKDGTVIFSQSYLYDDENYPTNVDYTDETGTTSYSITYQ